MLRILLVTACLTLSACATMVRDLPVRAEVVYFGLDARFALTHAGERHAGRLAWRRDAAGDELQVFSPFGQTVAEIRIGVGGASLLTADGTRYVAAAADDLLRDVLGYPLPIAGLADWVLARPHAAGRVERDGLGRPRRIVEDGWQISYEYDDAAPGALPAMLAVERDGGPGLRLRIEEWRRP